MLHRKHAHAHALLSFLSYGVRLLPKFPQSLVTFDLEEKNLLERVQKIFKCTSENKLHGVPMCNSKSLLLASKTSANYFFTRRVLKRQHSHSAGHFLFLVKLFSSCSGCDSFP